MLRHKLFRAETKVLEAATGRVSAVVSTEAKDRDGDIIRAAGWQLERFLEHPVLIANHDYFQLRSQIGEWDEMKVIKGNSPRLEGIARYYIGDGNAEADWGFKLAERGRAAFSVGFIPDMEKAKSLEGASMFPNYEFKAQELLEVSHVTIPSNPEALQSTKSLQLHPVMAELVAEALEDIPIGNIEDPNPWDEDAFIEKLISKLVPRFRADVVAAAAEAYRAEAHRSKSFAQATEAGLDLALKEYTNGH